MRAIALLLSVLAINPNLSAAPSREQRGNSSISEKARNESLRPKRTKPPSPVKAGIWALLFPGAGQFYNKQKLKGWAAVLLEGAGVGLVVWMHQKAENSRGAYLNAREDADFDRPFQEYERFRTTNNIFLVSLGAVKGAEVMDAWLMASKRRRHATPAVAALSALPLAAIVVRF